MRLLNGDAVRCRIGERARERQPRRSHGIAFAHGIAPKDLVIRSDLVIDSPMKLVAIIDRRCADDIVVSRRSRSVRRGVIVQDRPSDLPETARRNHVSGKRFSPAGRRIVSERIEDLRSTAEVAFPLLLRGNAQVKSGRAPCAQPFIVAHEERLVSHDGPADNAAELIAPQADRCAAAKKLRASRALFRRK